MFAIFMCVEVYNIFFFRIQECDIQLCHIVLASSFDAMVQNIGYSCFLNNILTFSEIHPLL